MGAYGGTAYASMSGMGDYYVIEDFELYNSTGELKAKWDSAGGTLDYFELNLDYPTSGLKCLRLEYWTYDPPYYCGVARTETPWIPADWTFEGVMETLSLWWVSNDPNLAAHGVDELYVRLKDSNDIEATVQYSDNWPVENLGLSGPQEWNIALQEFVDSNSSIDLTNVKMLEIGVLDGLGNPPAQTGTGFIYFDDIRLYPRRCVLKYGQPGGDINDDCVVDCNDVKIMADDWLDYDYSITAVVVDPCDPNLVGHWKLDGNADDSGPGGHHGTVVGNPGWDPNGKVGGAIEIVDTWGPGGDYIDCGGGKNEGEPNTWADITGEITVTAWVKPYPDYWWCSFSTVVNKGREVAWELHKSTTLVPDLYQYHNTISFYVDVPEVPWYGIHTKTDIFDSRWHHVAGVYEIHQPGVSSEVKVYTDGAKEASLSCSGSPIGTSDEDVFIGDIFSVILESHGWFGFIDDVRIYDRALEHSEVVGIVKEATAGPLASYEFESEIGGITPDSSGGHDGTLVNGASIVYDADRDSNVLELDGVDAYVDCGGGHDLNEPNCTDEPANCTWADITGAMTVTAWIKPDISEEGNYYAAIVAKGDNGGPDANAAEPNRNPEGWALQRLELENEISIMIIGTTGTITTVQGFTSLADVDVWDGKWHHIAAVYDGWQYLFLYIDGLEGTRFWTTWPYGIPISTTNYPIWIGASSAQKLGSGDRGEGYRAWKGRIDDVRIYDRALTEREIANVMGGADLYVPLESLANLYDEELINNKTINFKDYKLLAIDWLEDTTFPFRE
jgi:hypothetical protein